MLTYVYSVKRGRKGTKRLYSPGHHIPSKEVELDERKLALDDDSRQSNRSPSPLGPEKAPSPGQPILMIAEYKLRVYLLSAGIITL